MKSKTKVTLAISLVISLFLTKKLLPNPTENTLNKADTNIVMLAARIGKNEFKIDENKKELIILELNKGLGTNINLNRGEDYYFEEAIHNIYIESGLTEKEFASTLLNNSHLSNHTRLIESIIKPAPERTIKLLDDTIYVAVGALFGDDCGDINIAEAKNIILDLRGNYGGSTTCANNVLELVSEHDHKYIIESNSLDKVVKLVHKKEHQWNEKTVLIDENTASSAELIAWILKEEGWNIKGHKSFGKNSVQLAFFDTDYPYTINYGRYITNLCQTDRCQIAPDSE